MSARLTVDLDDLDDLVRRLDVADEEFAAQATALERRIGDLHLRWRGAAALAHGEAHREWTSGLAAMRAALRDLRSAVDAARTNHADAAAANLRMWQALR